MNRLSKEQLKELRDKEMLHRMAEGPTARSRRSTYEVLDLFEHIDTLRSALRGADEAFNIVSDHDSAWTHNYNKFVKQARADIRKVLNETKDTS